MKTNKSISIKIRRIIYYHVQKITIIIFIHYYFRVFKYEIR